MKTSIDYSEISKLIKQSTDVDVDIKFVKREHYPIQITTTVNLPIIGSHTIKVDVTLIYKEKRLFVFYDLGFLYKALLPKVVKYITDKGYRSYFTWDDDKKLFIINLEKIDVCKQVFDFVTIREISFEHEIFAEFDVNVNKSRKNMSHN